MGMNYARLWGKLANLLHLCPSLMTVAALPSVPVTQMTIASAKLAILASHVPTLTQTSSLSLLG